MSAISTSALCSTTSNLEGLSSAANLSLSTSPIDLKILDAELSSKTYLVGTSATSADLELFTALHPHFVTATHEKLLSHPSVTRYFNHIQHLPIASNSNLSIVAVDVNNIPTIVRVAEVKVKKPKAGEVAAEPTPVAKEEKSESKKEIEAVAGVKKVKKEKKEGDAPKKVPAAPAEVVAPQPWMVDLRVGTIIDVKLHPDADSLYVETIDIGEEAPRTVVSGLVKYIPIEQMMGKTLITVCNLKPASMRGVKSFAMVLCATSKEGKDGGIEFVEPPAGSKPGDRVYFEGFETEAALDLLNPKKKIFETVQPGFTTLDTKEAAWVSDDKKVHRIITARGVCSVPNFAGASLS